MRVHEKTDPLARGLRDLLKSWAVWLALGLALGLFPGPAWGAGALSVEIVNGYNLVVDSNVTSPATYGPKSAYIGAWICNTGDAALDNVIAYVGNYVDGVNDTPGIFPVLDSSAQSAAWDTAHPVLVDTGDYSLTIEAGDSGPADGVRYIGTLGPGECRIQYWLFSYPQCVNIDPDGDSVYESQVPPCDTSICGGVKPVDDMELDYDVWATTTTGGVSSALETRDFTMRNEISASANKIWPNTTSKVPNEYLAAIESVVGWGTLGPDGQPLDSSSPVYPGQRVITTQGIWYDLGNVVHGFDNDGDLVVDQNAWLQPVGDPASFDADCFRMVKVYGIVIVKLKTGGELLIPFQDQLYFENLPDNTGAVGLVYYQFIATDVGCSANMTPYQEAASGYDNEKFSADYGLSLGLASGSYGADLVLAKTDGVSTTAIGNTLTYSVTANNSGTGVHLGAPDLGVPLVFRDSVPLGTTFVAGSADDSPGTNLTEPAGSGSYTQGYTDFDGNLDLCPIDYNITSSTYVILYSDDNGVTWVTTEPAGVTDVKWMLITDIVLDGSHNGTDCVAPDGTFDDGALETSLPAGKAASVQFQVTVDAAVGPVICNTAGLGYGLTGSGVEAGDCTLVSGINSLSGTVFEDDEGSTGIYGNGVQDGDEAGIGNATDGVTVTLYYDLNGDGEYTSTDILYGTTTADANGDYSFTLLPDGPYLVLAKKYDGSISDGIDNAADDFKTGWGNTTYDPNLPPATDQGIIKMTEDYLQVILAVNIDLDRSTGVAQSVTTVDFGFAPPLRLTKSVAGNPDLNDDGKADTPIDEGRVFNYNITLENRLPAVGVQGPTGCQYTVWSMNGVNGSPSSKGFTDYLNAFDAPSPNRSVASALVTGGGLRFVYGTSFGLSQKPGAITKVEGLFFGYFSTTLTDDYLKLSTRISGTTITGTVSTAQIESYVGQPPDLDPNSSIAWDISTRKPGGTGSVTDWTWPNFANLELEINPSKTAAADQKLFYLDAIGTRVTTDADCVAGQSTTLSPVPLQDTYDTTRFEFVSADPAPLTVNTSTGLIQWEDVGPILPGASITVIVTVRALDVTGTITGTCSGSPDACNLARTDYGAYNVYYADGRQANDASDDIAVNIVGKAELRGSVWLDNSPNDGWPDNDGETRLPNVSVCLYGCMRVDGVTLETGTAKKPCSTITGGNYWAKIATTATDSNGDYEFIGLNTGYYIVEVGDTDGVPATGTGGNTAPYGGTQTAEPDDDQSSTAGNADAPTQGTFNNTWGNPAAWLESTQVSINLLSAVTEETVNGVDFGYNIPNATLYGNVWNDMDGDTATDPGDLGLSGFTVELYNDTDADGNPDGAAIATTTSNANGDYFFIGLAADDYVIVVTPPTLLSKAWTETVETTGGTGSLNDQIPVTVAAGEFSGSHDFGYTLDDTSSIGDTLYFDFDGDGSLDASESGIPNITVWLYRDIDRDGGIDAGADYLVGTDVTDADGKYLFEELPGGSYVVVVDTADPDFPTHTTATGDPDINAASIGDKVWLDSDGDGVLDAGEDGIPSVVVILYEDTDGSTTLNAGDKVVAGTTTDANGKYLFTSLDAGGYFVDIDESTLPGTGLALTSGDPVATPTLITLAGRTSATENLTADAGFSPSSGYALGNRVWSDADGDGVQDPGEAGIGDVDITVTGTGCAPCRATTDESGFWIVTGLTNLATYAVAVDTADLATAFASTTGGNSQNRTISSADNMAADFGYRFDGDGDGVLDEDLGDPTGTISGVVFMDADGDEALDAGEAMASTTVNLFDSSGNLAATTSTDVNGAYSFTGVYIGTYSVQSVNKTATRYSTIFLSAGETFSNLNIIYNAARQATADNRSSVSIGGVHADLMQDFGYKRFLGSIGDTVYHDVNENSDQDFAEPGLGGVTVNLYLWADEVADGGNGDGLVDSGELTLQSTAATTADDPLTPAGEGGKYLFTNLVQPPTDQYYMVEVDTSTLPGASWTLIADPDTDGYPCTLLPDPDDPDDDLPPPESCDSLQVVSGYSEGVNYLGADFGYRITGAGYAVVGDYLWVDSNSNGVLDTGELGVPYVTVFFDDDNDGVLDWADGNGNGVWDSGEGERWTETDPNGYYLFTNLADATYNYLNVLIGDGDWPVGLITTPVFEVRAGNDDSLDNEVNVIIASGAVTSLVDGDADTTDTCTGCDLNADFGYLYTSGGGNSLIGTICVDDITANGYCGATDTTYTGVDAGNEIALSSIQVALIMWADDGDNQAWASDGTLDPGDTFTLLGASPTDANGDFSFSNLPDRVLVVFSISESQNLSLTTNNGNTSVEDGGVASHQLYYKNTTYEGNVVTTVVRQALNLVGDADNAVKDLDFAFDGTLGGSIAYDFGDLPDNGSPDYNNTLLASGGARALVAGSSIHLGTDPGDGVSTEIDGKENATASGDTLDDGVNLVSTNWRTGQNGASVVVEASGNGWLTAWVDFNGDGDFNDVAERIINKAVTAGDNTLSFFVPDTMPAGANSFFSRFRIYPSKPFLTSSTGLAMDATFNAVAGEVEDYRWNVVVTAVVLASFSAQEESGRVVVQWETASEMNTAGFYLERQDEETGRFVRLHQGLLPGLPSAPQGGVYRFVDADAEPGQTLTYRLVERETRGRTNLYGPFTLIVDSGRKAAPFAGEAMTAAYAREARKPSRKSPVQETFPEASSLGLSPLASAPALARKGQGQEPARAKIFVEKTGLYRLDAYTVAPYLGRTGEEIRALVGNGDLKLTSGGRDIAWQPLGNGESLVFYGTGSDTIFTRYNVYWVEEGAGVKMQKASPFGDCNGDGDVGLDDAVSCLMALSGNSTDGFSSQSVDCWDLDGDRKLEMYECLFAVQMAAGLRTGSMEELVVKKATGVETFHENLHFEEDRYEISSLFQEGDADFWTWEVLYSGFAGYDAKNFTIRADGVDNHSEGKAWLSVNLHGGTSTKASMEHHARVLVNGTVVGEGRWDGTEAHSLECVFDTVLLNNGENTVEVVGLLDSGVEYSIFYVESMDLDYPRRFEAVDNRLDLPMTGRNLVAVSGFSSPVFQVFDVSDPDRPRVVTSVASNHRPDGYLVRFRPPNPFSPYLVWTDGALLTPLAMATDEASDLKNPENRADYLILCPDSLKDAAEPLAALRTSGGLAAKVVALSDVMDEFNHGVFRPGALRDFLDHARKNWTLPPRYVVLVGKGTLDYKDVLGFGDNLMPPILAPTPYGLFASDNRFVTLDGPTGGRAMAVGRLPVTSAEELAQVVEKIRAYEQAGAGEWSRKVMLLADNGDAGGNFPADSDILAGGIPSSFDVEKTYLSDYGLSAARQRVAGSLNSGALLVNFLGHGGYDRLTQEGLFTTADVPALANGDRLPVLAALTCVVGRSLPGYSAISEELVLHPGGGVIAAWSPTGPSLNAEARLLGGEFLQALFNGPPMALGDAVNQAMDAYAARSRQGYMLDIYNLLGDPALQLRAAP